MTKEKARIDCGLFCVCASEMKQVVGSYDQSQRDDGDDYLTDCAHDEWAHALLPQLTEAGPQSNPGKRKQKSPAGKITQRA